MLTHRSDNYHMTKHTYVPRRPCCIFGHVIYLFQSTDIPVLCMGQTKILPRPLLLNLILRLTHRCRGKCQIKTKSRLGGFGKLELRLRDIETRMHDEKQEMPRDVIAYNNTDGQKFEKVENEENSNFVISLSKKF